MPAHAVIQGADRQAEGVRRRLYVPIALAEFLFEHASLEGIELFAESRDLAIKRRRGQDLRHAMSPSTQRSTTLRSSLTLPGQEYANSACRSSRPSLGASRS